jgi:hypothetical protein
MVVRNWTGTVLTNKFMRSRRVLPTSNAGSERDRPRSVPANHQEKTVLKKAGILVAVAAAGVIAITPFAFAGNGHHESSSDVNYTNVEDGNVTNDCEFGQEGPAVAQDLTGGSSLLGAADLVTGAIAPITTQTQLGNCTNLNFDDLVDSNSNNTDETATRTEVEDSYNTDVDG